MIELTGHEWGVIRNNTKMGAALVQGIDFFFIIGALEASFIEEKYALLEQLAKRIPQ